MNSKNITKIVAINSVGMISMIVLFSPGILAMGLYGSAIHIALSAACMIAIPFGMFTGTLNCLKGKGDQNLISTDFSGKDEEIKTLAKNIEDFNQVHTFRDIAKQSGEQLTKAIKNKKKYEDLIQRRFGDGLSNQKFSSAVSDVTAAIVKNIAKVYNMMVIFDNSDYLSLKFSPIEKDSISDDVQKEKLALYEESITKIKSILSQNDKTMTDLYELMIKMSDIETEGCDLTEQTNQIKELTEQLQYYGKDK